MSSQLACDVAHVMEEEEVILQFISYLHSPALKKVVLLSFVPSCALSAAGFVVIQ